MHYVEWSIQKKSHATDEMKYLSQKNILSATPSQNASEESGDPRARIVHPGAEKAGVE